MIYITRTHKSIIGAAILILVIISGTIYIKQEKATEVNLGKAIELQETSASTLEDKNAEEEPEEIYVHIFGSIKNPGVVKVRDGTRLEEAVRMAGGATDDADLDAVNLAYKLADEDMVYIPRKGEQQLNPGKPLPGVNTVKSASAKEKGKVNINTASQKELETLTGIGPKTAEEIIRYRNENGPFKSIEDIKKVKNIGESKFNRIKEDITI